MSSWVRIADTTQIPPHGGARFFVDDIELAVFRHDGSWFAIEGRCPHKGASLSEGRVSINAAGLPIVACPWHDWEFSLATGECVGRDGCAVRPIGIRIQAESIEVDRDDIRRAITVPRAAPDGVQRVLVRYGVPGWVGVFGTVDRVACQYKDRVVVQTHRGQELGEVLSNPDDHLQTDQSQPTGEVLRVATPAELRRHRESSAARLASLIDACQQNLDRSGLALTVVDGEILFDETSAVLYYLGESSPDAGPLVTDVARLHELTRIELAPIVEPPSGGCGQPGCGGGGCHAGTD